MPKTSGVLLDADYTTGSDNVSRIELFVRTPTGLERFLVPDFLPHFFAVVLETDKKAIEELIEKLKKTEFGEYRAKIASVKTEKKTNFEHVLRLEFFNTNDLINSRTELHNWQNLKCFEYDIPFAKRYLIDHGIGPTSQIEIEFEEKEKTNLIQKISLSKTQELPTLRMASFDLETYSPGRFSQPEKDPILMISLVSAGGTLVFSTKKQWEKNKDARIFPTEKEMIKGFLDELNALDLDIIVTYNGDSFDFPYLQKRCHYYNLKCPMGFNQTEPVTKRKGTDNAVRLKGIQHVDAFQLLLLLSRMQVVGLVKFDLESVVTALFGVSKTKIKAEQINQIWDSEVGLDELFTYNLEDSAYTLKLVEKYWALMVEFCRLVRFNLFDFSRTSASQLVEQLLFIKSQETNTLAPNKPSETVVKQRMLSTFIGGFVKEPIAGLHENIAVLDFRSLHPSIIIAHNISPDTLKCEHESCAKGKNVSPDQDWFCEKKPGFIVSIISDLLKKRSAYKKRSQELDKKDPEYPIVFARQWALKILLNSFFGTLGFARFRWYSRECARAITSWSRHYIREVMQHAEEAGFKPLYGDSLTAERFVLIKNPQGKLEVKNIEMFFEENKNSVITDGKKEFVYPNGFQTLSVSPKKLVPEWKPVNFVVRHKTNKKIYRVNQKYGETRVTQDHSILVDENGLKETKPTEMDGKKFFSPGFIPLSEESTEIDLFEELQKYSSDISYKGVTKTIQVHKDNEFVWVGWMNQKEPIKVKRFVRFGTPESDALCRLLGAYIAEGSSSTHETSTRAGASIASSNVEWLKKLQKDYELLFNATTCVIPSMKGERQLVYTNQGQSKTVQYTDQTHKLQMMNTTTAVFFKMLCGQKSYGKKLPNFIFTAPLREKLWLLNKMLEGDGSHSVNKKLGYSQNYIKNNFSYTTKSLASISGLSVLLKQLYQPHSIQYRESKKCYTIKTCTTFNKNLKTKITEEPYEGFVYDLNVADNNNFVDACGQVLLHNTDSAFILIPSAKTQSDVKAFVEHTNTELPESMELELEGFYKRGIFVTKKEGQAAKKRYALMDFKDNLKIVGFEYVRRDWSNIAKQTQKKVIEALLKDGKPEKAVAIAKQAIADLKSGKVPKKELVVLTQLVKPVDKYEAKEPHIEAAKRAMEKGKQIEVGSVLGYIITKTGKTISDKANLEEFVAEGNYDADYYIQNQVIPAVIKILSELGVHKEDLIHGGKQTGLAAFG